MIFNFNQQTPSKGYLPARACLSVIKKAKFLLRNFAFILICISPRLQDYCLTLRSQLLSIHGLH